MESTANATGCCLRMCQSLPYYIVYIYNTAMHVCSLVTVGTKPRASHHEHLLETGRKKTEEALNNLPRKDDKGLTINHTTTATVL